MAWTPNNAKPEFNFDRVSSVIKNLAINELVKGSSQVLFSARDLAREVNKSNFDFSNLNRDNFRNNSELSSERIINLKLKSTDYIDDYGNLVSTPELEIELCTISMKIQSNDIITPLLNETGTIKQVISEGDWEITVAGILVGSITPPSTSNPLGGLPVKQIRDLREIKNAKISIEVESDYLNMVGINRIRFQSLDLPQDTNFINLQRFTLTGLSDDNELTIL